MNNRASGLNLLFLFFQACLELFQLKNILLRLQKRCASTGNRTRVTRVAGEYSTTRPPMLRMI